MAYPGDEDFMDEAYAAWGEGSQVNLGAALFYEVSARFVGLWWRVVGPLFTVVIAVAGFGFGVFAYRLEEQSVAQLIAIEFAAGIGIFLLTPIILALGLKWKNATRVGLLVVAATSAYSATLVEAGVTRHFLIELCSGLLLIGALELTVRRWAEWLKERRREAGRAAL